MAICGDMIVTVVVDGFPARELVDEKDGEPELQHFGATAKIIQAESEKTFKLLWWVQPNYPCFECDRMGIQVFIDGHYATPGLQLAKTQYDSTRGIGIDIEGYHGVDEKGIPFLTPFTFPQFDTSDDTEDVDQKSVKSVMEILVYVYRETYIDGSTCMVERKDKRPIAKFKFKCRPVLEDMDDAALRRHQIGVLAEERARRASGDPTLMESEIEDALDREILAL